MKKDNKGTKKTNKPKKTNKTNKLYVILDMTDMEKLPSQVILESKKELGMIQEAVEEVKVEVAAEAIKDVYDTNGKKSHWYNKLWNTIKSIF